jgi:glycosyltransferase involved in cell wall biosynthesis
VQAFRRLGRRLIVVGDGPTRDRVAADAPENVSFTGRVSDDELASLYARCRALVHPQEEDFGIAAVEAQAAGRPVIAYGSGGARDSVVPLDAAEAASGFGPRRSGSGALGSERAPTGVWFDRQTPESLMEAVERFEKREAHFDMRSIRIHAERFGPVPFRAEISREIRGILA